MADLKSIAVSDVETDGAVLELNNSKFRLNSANVAQLRTVVDRLVVEVVSNPSHEAADLTLPGRLY